MKFKGTLQHFCCFHVLPHSPVHDKQVDTILLTVVQQPARDEQRSLTASRDFRVPTRKPQLCNWNADNSEITSLPLPSSQFQGQWNVALPL